MLALLALSNLINIQHVLWEIINIYNFQNIPLIAAV